MATRPAPEGQPGPPSAPVAGLDPRPRRSPPWLRAGGVPPQARWRRGLGALLAPSSSALLLVAAAGGGAHSSCSPHRPA